MKKKHDIDTFKINAEKIHGNRFDYSKSVYINSRTKLTIICTVHGEFVQSPTSHLRSKVGCAKCSNDSKKMTIEQFLEKSKNVHGEKYDYSKTVYLTSNDKLTIICHKHGEFNQLPFNHLNGHGCFKCMTEDNSKSRRFDLDEILNEFKMVHGEKYDYSKVDYKTSEQKVCITCPIHGDFWQLPVAHKNGQGCPKCAILKRTKLLTKGLDLFLKECDLVHGEKYDYSKVEYINALSNVEIVCPTHGSFNQKAAVHLRGHGCPKCKGESHADATRKPLNEFLENCRIKHGDKYDYSKVIYKNGRSKVEICCPFHGFFLQIAESHENGHGCRACISSISDGEIELCNFIREIYRGKIVTSDRDTFQNRMELDIFLPEINLAIEYDGIYWHCELFKDSNYHLNKTLACQDKGIQLIHIWEDDWNNKKEIIKSLIKSKIQEADRVIESDKCEIRTVSDEEADTFLRENHIKGASLFNCRYALIYNDEMISLMTLNLINSERYELSRFCNKINTRVRGAASKLFNRFLMDLNPKFVIAYADKGIPPDIDFAELRFTCKESTPPEYYYIVKGKREDKSKFQKEEATSRNIFRVYDCGNYVYEWSK